MTDKRRTAEEIAKEIASNSVSIDEDSEGNVSNYVNETILAEAITKAIEDYGNQKMREEAIKCDEHCEKARNEGIEEAFKIADESEDCVCNDSVNCQGSVRIAAKIKALKRGGR